MRRVSPSRRALAFAALAALAAAPRPSQANTVPAIAWDAPAGCPDADALRAEVLSFVGGDVPTKVSDIRARVEQRDDGWHIVVTLTLDGRVRERTLTTESCEAAARAAAFIVAVAIDPLAGGFDFGPPPNSAQEAEPVVPDMVPPPTPGPATVGTPRPMTAETTEPLPAPGASEEPPTPTPTPSRPTRRRLTPSGLVQIGPGLQAGMVPVGVGLAAAAGLRWPRLRLTLGYTRWFRTQVRQPARPDLGGELSVHAANLRVGPVVRAGPLELPFHLGVEFGALHAVGVGGDLNARGRRSRAPPAMSPARPPAMSPARPPAMSPARPPPRAERGTCE